MNPSLENVANEFLLEKLDWKDSMKDDSFNPMLDVKLDLDELLKIKSEHTDLPTARVLENNSNRYTYRRHPHQIYKLMKEMSKIMGGFAVPTGYIIIHQVELVDGTLTVTIQVKDTTWFGQRKRIKVF